MRLALVLALLPTLATPASAARESTADRRLGLSAGTSRAFGRSFARRIALIKQGPRTSWEDQHADVRDQFRYRLQHGHLFGIERTSDGGFVAEVISHEEGDAPRLTQLALPALRRDRRGGPHSLVAEVSLHDEALDRVPATSWHSHSSRVTLPSVRRVRGRFAATTDEPQVTTTTTANGADRKLVHMSTMARPGATVGLRQLWVEELDGSPDRDSWQSELGEHPVHR